MLIYATILSPLLAGLLVLWAAIRLANPRVGWPETLLLSLLLGQAALLTPAAALGPLWVVLGLAAVWPMRALVVLALSILIGLEGTIQNYIFWPLLHNFTPAMLGAAAAVLVTVLAYQFYHWRWWPPLRHVLVGVSAATLLLVTSGLGTLPSVVVMSLLLTPLPCWAWWLAKQRQPF
jgi:hypothetical protein